MSFGFVFLHPFRDGNGRIHRWLLHWILAQREVVPEGVVVPISAVMLRRRAEYDAALEVFSRPLMRLLEFDSSAGGIVTVHNDLSRAYRYFDATKIASALSDWLDDAIDHELSGELEWLTQFDAAKAAVAQVVELPDRLLTLFIEVCLSSSGRLSRRKREKWFDMLTDEEIAEMEAAIRGAFAPRGPAR